MNDVHKTKKQLIEELEVLRKELVKLRKIETEQKKAKEKLWEGEEKYRRLYESMMDAYAKVDMTGQIQEFNPSFQRMLGFADEELFRMNYKDLTPAEWHDFEARILEEQVQAIGYSEVYEKEYRRKDGTIFPVELRTFLMRDQSGQPEGMWAIIRDISDRRRAEKALRESEERYRIITDGVDDIAWQLDLRLHFVYVSPAVERMLGYAPQEACGLYVADLLDEDGLVRMREVIQNRSERKTDFSRPNEYRMRHKDGHWVNVETLSSPLFDAEGHPTGFVGITRDIGMRKRAEEALKKSIQLLNDTGEMAKVGGWELDLSTKEVSLTEELYRIHGLEPGYNLKLEEALNFYAPESRPALEAALKKASETGKPYDLESLFIPRGSKDKIWVRSLGKAVYSGGKIVKLTGTFQNIDKYKRAEEALRVSLEKYRVLFESFPLGITISDKSGKIVEANHQSQRLLGITREAHAQRRIDSKEWQIIRKDGTPMPADEYASTRALRENRLIENVEMGIVKDKGKITWISVSAAPIPLEGYGVAIAYGDITERKRAEEELRLHDEIMENMSEGVYLIRLSDGLIVYTNPKFERMFGYEAGEMIGKPVTIVNAPTAKSPEQTAREIIGVLNRTGGWYGEINNIKKDGTPFWCYAGCSLFEHPEYGKVIVAVHTDITERKRTEKERERLFKQVRTSHERLQSLSRRLVEAQEVERRDLVRKLHDEVGPNLTALSINMNILRGQLPAETATKIEPRLNDSLKLVEETVERIRDVMAELRPPVLDDYGVTAALYWYGKQFSERTGIAAVVEGEELMPRLPLATETALFRITQEALTNVAKHAQAKQVIISLKSGEEKVYLTIADVGIGFEQQQQQQQQQHHHQQWGLINMMERAQAVGGTLNIETAPGNGTKIVVEVPRNK